MLEPIRELAGEITKDYPGNFYSFTEFPSGAGQLEIKADGEIWVMEYLPSLNSIGVSRMSTATFGWEGFENAFPGFDGAKEFLLNLLRDQP